MLAARALIAYRAVPLSRYGASVARSFSTWLGSGLYQISVNGSAVSLANINPDTLAKEISADILRLANAARETCAGVQAATTEQMAGWSAIHLYYAAFYYASAILRLCGRFPSYIRTSEFQEIRKYLNLAGLASPFKLSTGQFQINISPNLTTVQINKPSSKDGVHEYVWAELTRFLADALSGLETSSFTAADQGNAKEQLTRAGSAVQYISTGSEYLSVGRNNIQYRHEMGAWAPINKAVKKQSYAALCSAMWVSSDLSEFEFSIGVDYAKFINRCALICSLGHRFLAESAAADGGFLNNSYGKYHASLIKN
ncbi:hypothetical protein SAMN06297144_0344 [Sphingomonas guangdongensis]|uniref:Uncharacterized protein n=1 Tax=Sphingomonas guangdongensis TaxID=1141890 RepID=A0A285QG44_9SPHN|nr:hypothetical protein [Sphingomonas guangdongensis]SOB79042.1 hypothetical protein SAMN06297144_0344 [Sphingomonas guangdongensis]